MKTILKQMIEKNYQIDISTEAMDMFFNIIEYKKLSKSQTVIKYKEKSSKFYMLLDGITGSFVQSYDKKSYIRTLYTKGMAFGALSSLIQENITNASYVCLTDCEVFEADFNDFKKIIELNNEFQLIYNRVLEDTYIRTEKKFDDICMLNAKERFLNLNKEIPNISNLLPQYQIANYLNITPVQLSRIRKQLLKE